LAANAAIITIFLKRKKENQVKERKKNDMQA
jgi:hypothetical protein